MNGSWLKGYQKLWERKLTARNSDQRVDLPPAPNWRTRFALETIGQPASLLDVGCGSGGLLRALETRPGDMVLYGIEGVPMAAEAARQRCERARIYTYDLDGDGMFPVAGVDCATCLDVLEHVVDPRGLLERLHGALNEGGLLVLTTPNLRYWKHLKRMVEDGVVPPCSGDTELFRGGHLHLFMRHDLTPLLRQVGFREIVFERYGPQHPAPDKWAQLTGAMHKHIDVCQTELYVRARRE